MDENNIKHSPSKHEIRLKLCDRDWQTLHFEIQQSTARSRSEFLRNKIFGKSLTVKFRNVSLDECTEELTLLNEALRTAADTMDNAYEKLRGLSIGKESVHWLISYDLDRRNLLKQVEKISAYLQKFSEYDFDNK